MPVPFRAKAISCLSHFVPRPVHSPLSHYMPVPFRAHPKSCPANIVYFKNDPIHACPISCQGQFIPYCPISCPCHFVPMLFRARPISCPSHFVPVPFRARPISCRGYFIPAILASRCMKSAFTTYTITEMQIISRADFN